MSLFGPSIFEENKQTLFTFNVPYAEEDDEVYKAGLETKGYKPKSLKKVLKEMEVPMTLAVLTNNKQLFDACHKKLTDHWDVVNDTMHTDFYVQKIVKTEENGRSFGFSIAQMKLAP